MGKSIVEISEDNHLTIVENSEAISAINLSSEGVIIKSERIDPEVEKIITKT